MVNAVVTRVVVGAVAAFGLSVAGVGLSIPVGSGLPGPVGSCLPSIGVASAAPTDASSDAPSDSGSDSPSPSCDSQKKQCMSASAQEGIYGERYVPPDAVAMCMEAYRDCVNATG